MAVFELARYRVDPSKAGELQSRWQAAVAAVKASFPGLVEANLARLDERTWIDVWRWETLQAAETAAQGAPNLREAARLFGLINEVISMEHADIAQQS